VRKRGNTTQFAFAACIATLAMLAGSPPDAVATPPSVGGCQLFPPASAAPGEPSAAEQSAWNQDVSEAPVARNSAKLIDQIQRDGSHRLHPDFGSNPDYGIPYEVVPADQSPVKVTIGPNGYPDESDFGVGTTGSSTAPIPLDADVEAGSDHHAIVVQQGDCGLYEMYAATLNNAGSGWRAASTALFDLSQAPLTRPDGWTSADAAGLPILPGLVRYDEAVVGEIDHAIRVTFALTRRAYLHPATHYASSSCKRSRPAMGMRLRLRQGYFDDHVADYPAASQSRAVFVALRHYGMIVADNGSNWFITGETNPAWDDEDLDRLKSVPGRAFEVVKSAAHAQTPC